MSSLEQQLVRLKVACKEEAVKTGTGEIGDGRNVLGSLSLSSIGSPQISSPAGRTSGYMDLSDSSSPGNTSTNTTNTSYPSTGTSPSSSRDEANSSSNSGRKVWCGLRFCVLFSRSLELKVGLVETAVLASTAASSSSPSSEEPGST